MSFVFCHTCPTCERDIVKTYADARQVQRALKKGGVPQRLGSQLEGIIWKIQMPGGKIITTTNNVMKFVRAKLAQAK